MNGQSPFKLTPDELRRTMRDTYGVDHSVERIRRAGAEALALSNGDDVDVLALTAVLIRARGRRLIPATDPKKESYDAHKERARSRQESLSKSGRDIGELPRVVNPDRRARCERDFRAFCEEYFPATFTLEWSDDHLKVIARIENAVLHGGLFALAMPRGSGKTSIVEIASIWALMYGHREFVVIIGADEPHAENMLDSIKAEFETNDRLADDFPEICHPIRALEQIHQRAGGQLYRGKPTKIGWKKGEIILPTIEGSRASGALVRVAGITGGIRGMKHKRADGTSIRPSLVLVDDPQTDESAKSPVQCESRRRVLAGAVLGLAGPGRKISGLMTVTVVKRGDMADRILDRDLYPDWQGERTRMVNEFPKNEKLWARYAEIRSDELKAGRGLKAATEFYSENREAMDEGADVAWEQRFNHDELSAIQHAMNLKLQDEVAFFAEYQNEPLPEEDVDEDLPTADDIMLRVNRHKRNLVPVDATILTSFIDVQGKMLFWAIAAWRDDFTGSIINYGSEPDQGVSYFTLRDARRTLQRADPKAGLEGQIYAGLERLTTKLMTTEYPRDGGGVAKMDLCLVDAAWGQSTDTVFTFCRRSPYGTSLRPSFGRYVGATSIPFDEYRKKPGERVGLNWRIPIPSGKRATRYLLYDTNFWKSFIMARFKVAMGDAGALTVFGTKPSRHRLFAEQVTAETRTMVEARNRRVGEWKLVNKSQDNHWFDCVTGCAVGASMMGAALPEMADRRVKKRVKFSEMQRAKRRAS